MENALAKAKDEKGLKRVARFLKEGPCADCGGTRLSAAARAPHVRGLNLAEASAMTLDAAVDWVRGVPESLSADMPPMATNICESFLDVARRLLDLGLGYLALDRAGATLSVNASVCSSPVPCATAPPACCMCSTSRPLACTPRTWMGFSA